MAGKIFINYRRGDDPGFTTALYIQLEARFGKDRLFMDVEGHIKPGDDFVEVLGKQVAECDVLLAIIGPRWESILMERGDDPDDFVVIEIQAALNQGKRLIPVLVGSASFPRVENLPERIKPMARKNAVAMRPDRFMADAQGLIKALDEAFQAAEAERAARTEAEKRAAEEARRKREAEEAERAAQREAEARARSVAGLSPEEIRKAEELANWDFIKNKTEPGELRNHVARFPGGTTERFAYERLAAVSWELIDKTDKAALQAFIDEFDKSSQCVLARETLNQIEYHEFSRKRAKTLKHKFVGPIKSISGRSPSEFWRSGHSHSIRCVGFSPDGLSAISCSVDKTIKIWDVLSGKLLRTLRGHADTVTSVMFSPDGRTALSGSFDRTLKLWDVSTGREIRTFGGHEGRVFSVAFSPDGRFALSGSDDNTLKLWDVAKGDEIRSFTGHKTGIMSTAFSPDGRRVLAGSGNFVFLTDSDMQLIFWDLITGAQLLELKGHRKTITSVAFAPDGLTAISGSLDKTARHWDLRTGQQISSYEFSGVVAGVLSVAFAPDGRTTIAGSDNSTLKVWDLATSQVIRTFTGHEGRVNSVAYSPDGRFALSGSYDKTLKLWDVSEWTQAR